MLTKVYEYCLLLPTGVVACLQWDNAGNPVNLPKPNSPSMQALFQHHSLYTHLTVWDEFVVQLLQAGLASCILA